MTGRVKEYVPAAAWEFFVGGYQPAQKWLKDRKGRVLTSDDLLHYKSIISALVETRRLMDELAGVNFPESIFPAQGRVFLV